MPAHGQRLRAERVHARACAPPRRRLPSLTARLACVSPRTARPAGPPLVQAGKGRAVERDPTHIRAESRSRQGGDQADRPLVARRRSRPARTTLSTRLPSSASSGTRRARTPGRLRTARTASGQPSVSRMPLQSPYRSHQLSPRRLRSRLARVLPQLRQRLQDVGRRMVPPASRTPSTVATPTDSVTLAPGVDRHAAPVHPRSIKLRERLVAGAGAGSNAGCEKYSTPWSAKQARGSRSPVRAQRHRPAPRAAARSLPASPGRASSSARFSATIGARSRMRLHTGLTICSRARGCGHAVRSMLVAQACSRWLRRSTRGHHHRHEHDDDDPDPRLEAHRTYSTTCATRSRPSGG